MGCDFWEKKGTLCEYGKGLSHVYSIEKPQISAPGIYKKSAKNPIKMGGSADLHQQK